MSNNNTTSNSVHEDAKEENVGSATSPSATDLDYQAILAIAKQAAKAAGAEIQKVWWEETNSLTSKSSNVDLVTETDELAEQLIMEIIQRI